MWRYVARRALQGILVLWLVTILIFSLVRILPVPLFVHLRRDAAPIDLAGGQDIGPIPQHTSDEGRGPEGVVDDDVARDQRDDRGGGVVWRDARAQPPAWACSAWS